jgi:hypothetical protein
MRTRVAIAMLAILAILVAGADDSRAQSAAVPAVASELEKPIGKVIETSGVASIEHTAAVVLVASIPSGPTAVKRGDMVYRGDVVQTGANGKISITFADGTAFNLSSNARMVLNEFVYDPKGQSNSTLFSLTRGTFTIVSGQIAKTGDMKFDTPVATMGIRGTTPHVEVAADGSVRFSTLVEGSSAAERSQTRTENSPDRLTPEQANRYNRLFRLDHNICRNC